MATTPNDLLMEDSVTCPTCGDSVPRGHTVLRADSRRICWFCHTDEQDPIDNERVWGEEDEAWDDDDEDWDDWD